MAETAAKEGKWFSLKTAITMAIVLVVFTIVLHLWMKPATVTDPSKLKTQTDCEKAGYKWDAATNTCTKA